jgi:endonuclease/exonuclease/phosphatase (EEP) superfamily protein YafD
VSFLFFTSALMLVLMTLIPLSIRRDWWIRALDFPSLQIATACIIWLLFWFTGTINTGFFTNIPVIAVFCVLIYQCRLIYPYTELHAQEVDSYLPEIDGERQSLKILTSNVLMTNRDSSKLLHLIAQHQPDVFIALESDLWWEEQFEGLTDYPFTIKCPLDNLYGMHVYSRYPLTNTAINYEVEEDKPSMNARIGIDSKTFVNLYVMHPAPPSPSENAESTERDVELIKLAERVTDCNDRIIIAGDLNDVAWSATTRLFRQVSGLLDPRIGRGMFNTFNAFHWFARWPLDHVFLSNHFKIKEIQRLPAMGSDHFPLMIELAIMQSTEDDSIVEESTVDEARLESIRTSTVAKDLND